MAKKMISADGEIIEETDAVNYRTEADYKPFFKTPFNHDTNAESDRTALKCLDKSKTQQQFAADADINVMMRKFMETGEEPAVVGTPNYMNIPGDGSQERSLQDEMVTAWEVQQAWESLPAKVRNVLKDPKTFSEYVELVSRGEADMDEAADLGIINKKAPPVPPEPPTPPGGTPAPSAAKGASDAPKS